MIVRSTKPVLAVCAYFACCLFGLAENLPAQSSRIYGDVTALYLDQRDSAAYVGGAVDANVDRMTAMLQGKLYMSIADEKLGSVFGEFDVSGSLSPTALPSGFANGSAPPPQLNLGVGQLYLQAPIGDGFRLTVGKKPVSLGFANYFNVSNCMSPRTLSPINPTDTNPAIAQLDWFVIQALTVSGFFYFSDTTTWDKTNGALAVQLQLDPVNIDVYGYLEQQSRLNIGYNMAVQLDRIKLYAEGLVSAKSRQATLVAAPQNNSATDFQFNERTLPGIQQTAGVSLALESTSFNIEYLFRSEGLADVERARLSGYIAGLVAENQRNIAIAAAYRQFAWDSHYLAFNVSSSLINDLLKIDATVIGSAGAEPTNWKETAGLLARLQLTFVPTTALQITAFVQHVWGGVQAEFSNYQKTALIGGVVCTYNFSTKKF